MGFRNQAWRGKGLVQKTDTRGSKMKEKHGQQTRVANGAAMGNSLLCTSQVPVM